MPDPPPPPPDNPGELDIGIVTYHDDSDKGQHYYHHWAIVVEQSRRRPDEDATIEFIDHQRMHILHYRDYDSRPDEPAHPKGVQVFSGEIRLGDLFEKVIFVGKIHVSQVTTLFDLARRLVDGEMQAGRPVTCQSFVELVFASDELKELLVQKKEFRLRLYGRLHDPPPPNVWEHVYSYAGTDLAGKPMY